MRTGADTPEAASLYRPCSHIKEWSEVDLLAKELTRKGYALGR